jgi:hypothetical protein
MDIGVIQEAEAQVRESLHDVIPRPVFESRVQERVQALLKEKENHGSQPASADA